SLCAAGFEGHCDEPRRGKKTGRRPGLGTFPDADDQLHHRRLGDVLGGEAHEPVEAPRGRRAGETCRAAAAGSSAHRNPRSPQGAPPGRLRCVSGYPSRVLIAHILRAAPCWRRRARRGKKGRKREEGWPPKRSAASRLSPTTAGRVSITRSVKPSRPALC